jgi:hypothetical protein
MGEGVVGCWPCGRQDVGVFRLVGFGFLLLLCFISFFSCLFLTLPFFFFFVLDRNSQFASFRTGYSSRGLTKTADITTS